VKPGSFEPSYYRMLKPAFEARSDADYDVAFVGDLARVEQLLSHGGGG
jgi:hypothetical protein